MQKIVLVLSIILIISVPAQGTTVIGIELYPERMDNLLQGDWLYNGNEWFATEVSFNIPISNDLDTSWNIKTYIFATNGITFAPSSVKFSNSINYSISQNFNIKYEHYCHHYFQQFPDQPQLYESNISFEYEF